MREIFRLSEKHLLVIGGATATGKSDVALMFARRFGAPILSADSRQFYREMTIGTAKPPAEVLAEVPHHFINSLSIHDSYSVGRYEQDALALLADHYRERDLAIVAGGSGLFIQALCTGMDRFPDISETTRQWVADGEAAGGIDWLRAQVEALDPAYFAAVDRHNPARLRRALEVCRETGKPYSAFRSGRRTERPFSIHYLLLRRPRAELYARIDARVDAMVEAGLEAEALALYPHRHLPALHTVGYEEWFDHFDGRETRAETIRKIKQHTRNYAKRQDTWFRKYGAWQVFHPDEKPWEGWVFR
ncbi:MAG: tRNA (adenosine(37)-N6)-dimethylallyltransferase MiaA [Saprospiraceae bacterium]|nr:tRNA (adenosine(37)-N6)-dimethylallyltransferase MiaA [Saprospiraceae bacterium]